MDLTTVIGLIAASLTTGCLVPQVIKTVRTRETKAISLGMYVAMVTGIAIWLVYGLMLGELPLILANTFSLVFAGIVLVYKVKLG